MSDKERSGASRKAKKSTRAPDVGARPANQRPPAPDIGYRPFDDGNVPLQPVTFMAETTFAHDSEVQARRYMTRELHGRMERTFDADNYSVPADFRKKLESVPLDVDYGADPALDEEVEARAVQQPPEVMEQFRQDLRNKDFHARHRDTVRRAKKPLPEVQRREELEEEGDERRRELQAAFARSGDNPDFFAQTGAYQGSGGKSAKPTSVRAKDVTRKLIEYIDRELDEIDDDDLDAKPRVLALRDERAALLERQQGECDSSSASDAESVDEDADLDDRVAAHKERAAAVDDDDVLADDNGEPLHVVTENEAKQLLTANPFASLASTMRADFMQLAEPAAIFAMLQPLVLAHEPHRRHLNAVELVRAMALCGAKYDGFARLSVRTHLATLLDESLCAPFVDAAGRLGGGHEHYDEKRRRTTMVVLKFFVVRHNKSNVQIMRDTLAAEAQRIDFRTADARDAERERSEATRNVGLNKRGLYDVRDDDAGADEAVDDDGTDEFGSLHHIRYLRREFMFCVRVACVEMVPGETCVDASDALDNPSLDDESCDATGQPLYADRDEQSHGDDDALDASAENQVRGAAAPSADAGASSGAFADVFGSASSTQQRYDSSGSLQSASGARANRWAASMDESDEEASEVEHRRADNPLDVHSDDEDSDDAAHRPRALPPYLPTDTLVLGKDAAERAVGRWKADEFSAAISRGALGALCVRAYQFYSAETQE